MTAVVMRKATPVLIVERVEAVVPFWEKLGATATVSVPDAAFDDGRLAFVIVASDGIEVMYQTIDSVMNDLVKAASVKEAFRTGPQQTTLFIEVDRLEAVESALRGEPLVMPRRTTFYGATEAAYADPAGNIVVFAEHAQAAGS
jgi:uncharacterized glyoxalase superfamily protein PhnB